MSRDMADIKPEDLLEKMGDFSKKHEETIIDGTTFEEPRPDPETQQRLDVVLVYAFDCTDYNPAWYTTGSIFWMVQEKLTGLKGSSLGYIYPMLTPNEYTLDMKVVDREDSKANDDYTPFDERTLPCTKDMASGLKEANKMLIRYADSENGIILFFSDGSINEGDFFDGTEDFKSEFPVHTFTLGGDAYNEVLQAIADKSNGTFHDKPVSERPMLSEWFPLLLDSIVDGTTYKEPHPGPETGRLNVVLVYAFDCTDYTPAWYTTGSIFWMVQERLTGLKGSSLGYIYSMLTPNEYTSDMKVVDREDSKANDDYTPFDERTLPCTKDMASGLKEANKMLIKYADSKNSIILFFSNGSINEGDFFDGMEDFKSEFRVHTFTLGGDTYNEVLQAIADKSGGTFDPIALPEGPEQSVHFKQKLDSLLSGPKTTN